MSDILLSAQNVSKSYAMGKRTLEVLRSVSLSVARGDFLALRGASGAGKSTLLHLFGGLDSPNSGEIHFQSYHLLPELDALENVCLPARMLRKPVDIAEKRGRELLARVGLGARMDHKPYELSGGEQQRVAIARALMNEPELILADEPTGNLDSHTGTEIVDLLVSLRDEKNTTLIIATHDAHVAARAPKVIQLVDGQIQ